MTLAAALEQPRWSTHSMQITDADGSVAFACEDDRSPFIGPPAVRANGWSVTARKGCRRRRAELTRSVGSSPALTSAVASWASP